jgi:type IV secretion system protein VirD4
MSMPIANKIMIGTFSTVALVVSSCASVLLAGAVFLILNERNPFEVKFGSYLQFWQAYHGDPAQQLRLYGAAAVACAICFVLMPLLIVVGSKRQRALHGDARFAATREVRAAGLLSGQGIMVGKYKKQYLTLSGQQFVLLAAPTRSGKGVGVVIPNLLQWPDSVMVLDIKGENYDITAGFRAKYGQKVFAFRPFNEQGATHRYNPLAAVRRHAHFRVGDLQAIATIFFPASVRDEGDNAKFFNDKARDLFVGLGLYLLETPEYPVTLGELLRQSSSKGRPLKDHLQAVIAEREQSDRPLSEECVAALDRFLSNADTTLSSIQATFTAPLAIFADPIVDAATSASDFSLAEVRKRQVSIYIIIPPHKLPVCSLLCNLLFSQLIDLNTRELPRDNPALKYQCLLLMDEFTALGRVAILAKGVGYIAGYNLRFLTIVQSMSQLAGVYGKDEAKTFATNHALQILYAPRELQDAKEYSEMLGTLTQKSRTKGRNHSFGSGDSSSSSSESEHQRALMLPQELRELGAHREILLLENCKPVLCEKIRYYDDPAFQGRLRPPPPVPAHDIEAHLTQIRQRARARLALATAQHDASVDLPALDNDAGAAEIGRFVDALFDSMDESCDADFAAPPRDTLPLVDGSAAA